MEKETQQPEMPFIFKRQFLNENEAKKHWDALWRIKNSTLWASKVASTIFVNAMNGIYRMSAKQSDILNDAAFQLNCDSIDFPIDIRVQDEIDRRAKESARRLLELDPVKRKKK